MTICVPWTSQSGASGATQPRTGFDSGHVTISPHPHGTRSILLVGIFIYCLDDPVVGEVATRRNHADSPIPLYIRIGLGSRPFCVWRARNPEYHGAEVSLIVQGGLDPQLLEDLFDVKNYMVVLRACPEPQQYIDGLYKVHRPHPGDA